VDLEEPGALADGHALVEADGRQADGRGRLEHGDPARVLRLDLHDPDRAGAAVPLPRPVVVLQPGDERPALVGAPALAAHRRPLVEVLARRPERDARVVRRAAAEDLAAGVAQEAVAALLRLDRVVPVVA